MSGYRPPSTEPRGKWAQAIHRKRRSDGISQTGAFELLGSRLGLGPKSRAAYVAIDLGLRQPTDAEAVILADWLGGYPSDDMETGGAGATADPAVSSLILALAAQTEAITALVGELREARAERDAALEELRAQVRALEAWRSNPDPSEVGESAARSAPRVKAR